MNMITAHEALAQGSTPAVFFSIARFNERLGKMATGQAARKVARELAGLLGMDLGGHRRKSAGNQNRSERRAA